MASVGFQSECFLLRKVADDKLSIQTSTSGVVKVDEIQLRYLSSSPDSEIVCFYTTSSTLGNFFLRANRSTCDL